MTNVQCTFNECCMRGVLPNGTTFLFSKTDLPIIESRKWYISWQGGRPYLIDSHGVKFNCIIFPNRVGFEVDHINLDTLDNRRENLRLCTHQQNHMNQPPQTNNTSGVSGVSFYAPRNKYRARIKVNQHDIHLGYYDSMLEAIQARNVGMEYMFGEFGRYNDVPPALEYIRKFVYSKCKRFARFASCKAFYVSTEVPNVRTE